MLMFLFPGQGSQEIGMGKEFYENFSIAREIFEEVDDSLGYKLSDLMFNGNLEELSKTEHTQPAIMAVSMAIFKTFFQKLKKKPDEIIDYFGGHSLGEFSALCAAEFFSVKQCAKILQKRASFMNQAMHDKNLQDFGMIAALGIDSIKAKNIAEHVSKIGFCEIANDNCPGQIVFSCDIKAINELETNYKKYGLRRAVRLKVNIPFHSSMMDDARLQMKKELDSLAISANHLTIPILMNSYPKETVDKNMIITNLIKQTNSQVRFREIIENAVKSGVENFVECGHGNILSSLVKKIAPQVQVFSLNSIKTLEDFLEKAMFL